MTIHRLPLAVAVSSTATSKAKEDDHVSQRPSSVADGVKVIDYARRHPTSRSHAQPTGCQRCQATPSPSHHHHHHPQLYRQAALGDGFSCCGCWISGNAISLLVAAILFAAITVTQWIFAEIANSDALKADCVSMGVDVLAFLGNLFAECNPFPDSKRKVELTMSGISHVLLLFFTVQFIIEGYGDATEADDDNGEDVNGYIVLGFALGGLAFDMITLLTYKFYGTKKDEDELAGEGTEDAVTCGINTNMCAALLHVVSDLARSTTTLVESIIIINMPNVNSTQADGVSTLIVCSIIVIGATGALLTWLREVYIFAVTPTGANDLETHDVVRNSLMRESSGMIQVRLYSYHCRRRRRRRRRRDDATPPLPHIPTTSSSPPLILSSPLPLSPCFPCFRTT